MIILRNTTGEQTVYVPRSVVDGGVTPSQYLKSGDLKTVQGENLVGTGNIQIDVPTKTSELTNDSQYTDKNYVDSKLAMKADKTEVEAELSRKADVAALGSYALKTDVPTKTSELTNDSGFIDESGLSGYYTKEESDGRYALKGSVPTKTSELTNDSGFIDDSALSGYALKSDVPTKTSQLTNDSGFIDDSALSGYATKADLNNYATKTELDTKADVTELDNYATKAEIPDKTSELTNDSDFTTTGYVNTKITEALGTVENKLSTI